MHEIMIHVYTFEQYLHIHTDNSHTCATFIAQEHQYSHLNGNNNIIYNTFPKCTLRGQLKKKLCNC